MADTLTTLRAALEALCKSKPAMYCYHEHWKAVDGLRALIASMEAQEPVAWMKRTHAGGDWDAYDFSANQYGDFQMPLYTHAQPSEPKAEPVQELPDEWPSDFATFYRDLPEMKPEAVWPFWNAFYTHQQPKAEPARLTDAEIEECSALAADDLGPDEWELAFARKIESKIRGDV